MHNKPRRKGDNLLQRRNWTKRRMLDHEKRAESREILCRQTDWVA